MDNYLVALHVQHVVAGFDYSYGKKGEGKMTDLAKYADGRFEVTIVDKQTAASDKISSTNIRRAIIEGELEEANQLLGYPYTTKGTVIHGDKRGRTIGFPTANIRVNEDYLIPKLGVYAVKFRVNGKLIWGWLALATISRLKTIKRCPLKYIF